MTDINLDMSERNEVYAYLENLRMSGETNMFGFDKHYARAWLTNWMQNYGI